MKKLFSLACLLMLCLTLQFTAQASQAKPVNPPQAVVASLQKAYPGVTKVRWKTMKGKAGATIYVARFQKGKAWYRLLYDEQGNDALATK